MDKIKACFDRIRIIKGVNYGMISDEQVQSFMQLYELDDSQKQELLHLLESEGIRSMPEAQLPRKPMHGDADKHKLLKTEEAENQKNIMDKKSNMEEQLQRTKEALMENPSLAEEYEQEIPYLQNAIVQYTDKYGRNVNSIAHAVVSISNHRIREQRENGWTCGTYVSNVRKSVERRLNFLFDEEELKALTKSCQGTIKEDSRQKDILVMLLHSAPHLLVHKRNIDLFG